MQPILFTVKTADDSKKLGISVGRVVKYLKRACNGSITIVEYVEWIADKLVTSTI